MDNNIFESDQKNPLKKIEDIKKYEGAMANMDKYVKFWEGIWERDDHAPNMP